MGFVSKFGKTLRRFGEKLSGGVRALGNKAGDYALGAAPVLGMIPGVGPELAAGAAAFGGVAKGVAGLAGAAQGALRGNLDINAARESLSGIRTGTADVREAYGKASGTVRSTLERMR